MNNKIVAFEQHFNTSTHWTAIFKKYGGIWFLKEIRADSPLFLSNFKRMTEDIEDIFKKLNKKN